MINDKEFKHEWLFDISPAVCQDHIGICYLFYIDDIAMSRAYYVKCDSGHSQ